MEQLKALHINSYFLSNKIHVNFYHTISKVRQDKFLIPVYKSFRSKHEEGINIDYVFTGIDKLLFFTKVFKVLLLFYKKRLYKSLDYIHAHTLISDGLPAYLLCLLTKKQCVVTVRVTDINYFIKRSLLFRYIGKAILEKATIVFFVSPSYREIIKEVFPALSKNKLLLLPNGIDDFWIRNSYERISPLENTHFEEVNLLFVGQLIRRKNLEILIDFLKTFNDRRYNLTIAGTNNSNYNFSSLSKSIKRGNTLHYVGEAKERTELLNLYRQNDIFIMLSTGETFGVVYIEAISQGLPVIYTRGDGIDGYFKEGEVGYACNPESLEELKLRVDLVISNYKDICKNTTKSISRFDWSHLVNQYLASINSRL